MAFRRGLDAKQEQDPRLLIRDTRTLGMRISDFFKEPTNAFIVLATGAISVFIIPGAADAILLIGLGVFAYTYTRKQTLPFKMPQRSGLPDHNDLLPGSIKPRKARGICFFGNEKDTRREMWFTNDDMRTHVLIFGSTGSGKTETLVSLAYNALIQGSGFIYVDGKGDNSLYAKVFSMVRRMGREDDMLLINFMTGARDIVGPQEARVSNTMNPFCSGSSGMLSQLVVSLMDSSSSSSDGDMWKGRAITFVEALMRVLVYARDKEWILLDANTIRNYFTLLRLEPMTQDLLLIRDNDEPVSLADAPDSIMEPMKNYMLNLPGYNPEKKGKQVSQVLEQHGFITMQLTRVFSSLADAYGHILRTKLAEVDMRDVVLNRRILVVLLPALEKSPDELANLGKVIIASLRAMMAAGLGDMVEGHYHDVIERKPTNSPTPFMCILDEYGYYAVKGFAVVPAQARSLGFSTIFAGQDLPAFQKASKEEAMSIGANTNIKIAMKLEDPLETWDFFSKTAGEAFVTKVDAFQTNAQSVTNTYMDTRSSSSEKRARIDLLDLKDQRLGEAHVFFKSKIVRADLFFANPKPVRYMRLNHFMKVEAPQTRLLIEMQNRFARFAEAIDSPTHYAGHEGLDEIPTLAEILRTHQEKAPIERGVAALLALHKHETPAVLSEEAPVPFDEMHVFTEMRNPDKVADVVITEDYEAFQTSLLNRRSTYDRVNAVERASGKPAKHASNIADEIIKDMQVATVYPPFMSSEYGLDTLLEKLKAVQEAIHTRIETQRFSDADDDFDFDDDDLF